MNIFKKKPKEEPKKKWVEEPVLILTICGKRIKFEGGKVFVEDPVEEQK